jgi:rhamnogalacturonyl hydrolase YesR
MPVNRTMPESSGSGFLCYAITWGMNRGILDRITFEPVVRKAWRGLTGVVSSEGQVQYGQLVGDRPTEIKQENTHEYVTGAFLLAASEIYKLGK